MRCHAERNEVKRRISILFSLATCLSKGARSKDLFGGCHSCTGTESIFDLQLCMQIKSSPARVMQLKFELVLEGGLKIVNIIEIVN